VKILTKKVKKNFKGDSEDFNEESEKKFQENVDLVGDLPEDLNSLTVKELKNHCKANDINVPPKARKADIIKIIKYVLGTD